MNRILHKNVSNIKKLIVKDIIFAKSYLSFRAGYNIFCRTMSFRNRNIAAVTVNASVTNITRSFMYNRFKNENRFGEKFITLIIANFNGITKSIRSKRNLSNVREKISINKSCTGTRKSTVDSKGSKSCRKCKFVKF